ncbi:MAG: putative dehydrogenase [Deltaproteobacteria bacterium]|nr:putative dehydrogenase [Deltaproteobacteria bacterium]
MKSQYDVIVVGAGIGGVICGAYTAAGGLSTALFEKAAVVGGRIQVDKTSPGFTGHEHWVAFGQGWGGGAWYRAAREVDADVRFYEVPEPCLYYRGTGMKRQIAPRCASASALTSYYESLFPTPLSPSTRKAFIKAFNYAALIPHEELWREPLSCTPFFDWKEKLSDDPTVIGFLATIAANSTQCNTDEAMQHLSVGGLLGALRFWWMSEAHCVAFKPNLVDGLVRPFTDAMARDGGELFLGTEVLEVIVENDRAKGVVVKTAAGDRREIRAGKVVVNANFTQIPSLFRTVPPEVQPAIDAYTALPLHDLTVYAELDRPVTAEPHPVSVADPKTGGNLLMIWSLSNAFSWNAPEGKQLIFATRVLPFDKAERERVSGTLKEEIDDIIDEVFPGYRGAVVTKNYASHFPLWQYQHTWYKKIPYRSTSVKDLFFVGDCVEPQQSMTVDAAASTGVFTGKAIRRLEGR